MRDTFCNSMNATLFAPENNSRLDGPDAGCRDGGRNGGDQQHHCRHTQKYNPAGAVQAKPGFEGSAEDFAADDGSAQSAEGVAIDPGLA